MEYLDLVRFFQSIHYFNGITALYESLEHEVPCPTVAALGPIETRTKQLTEQMHGKTNQAQYSCSLIAWGDWIAGG
jgi:hypothetical protein